ncbi:CGNR zinc finger domain-containing protein [Kitasatospora sp. McL0602]|uniref:CGNR zinc finger domain-containing protein n=1 Tax=Kitasatospora sp. McL0602 TaxID=3439530 RepID=UPI003F8C194A
MSSTLVGEPLALDLVNTRSVALDLLSSADDFRGWLDDQAGRITAVADAGAIDLDALRALRAHVAEAVDSGRDGRQPPAAALAALVDAQRAAPAHRELTWDGAALAAVRRRSGAPTAVLLAELAEAAVDLLTDPATLARVRGCAAPDCCLVFLPANPRRRWCSPTLCGNRVRVARYYQRHKGPAE